jgi:hypothetical protein
MDRSVRINAYLDGRPGRRVDTVTAGVSTATAGGG